MQLIDSPLVLAAVVGASALLMYSHYARDQALQSVASFVCTLVFAVFITAMYARTKNQMHLACAVLMWALVLLNSYFVYKELLEKTPKRAPSLV